jgi:hypothetical protein
MQFFSFDESGRPATEFCEASFSRELQNLLRLCGFAARLILRSVFGCVKHSGGSGAKSQRSSKLFT